MRLNTGESHGDIQKMPIDLKENMQVLLDDNDGMSAIGSLKHSEEENIWVAEIDWDSVQNY